MIRSRTRSRGGGAQWYSSAAIKLNGVAPTRVDDLLNNRYYTSTAGTGAFPFGSSVRTTNAMMFDGQGRLVWAPANMFLNSAALSTQSVTVNSGASYTVSFTGTGTITLSGGGAGSLVGTGVGNRVSLNFTTTTASVTFTVTGSVTLAQLELTGVDSPKAYIPTTGTAVHGPRLDTNPATLAPAGLLVEAQITSLISTSADLAAGAWTLLNATTTGGQSSPMGLNNAFKLGETTANAVHNIGSSLITLAANGSFTVSIFAKAVDRNFATIQVNDATNANAAWCAFSLITGAVTQVPTMLIGTFTNMTAWTQNCGNGWYRCFFSGTSAAVANITAFFGISTTGTDRSYTGTTGSGIFLFGPMMLAVRGSPQSYTPTFSTASVTRAQDILSSQGVGWLNTTQGVLYTEFSSTRDADTSFPELTTINDGTTDNRIFAFNAFGPTTSFPLNRVVTGGVTQADLQVNAGEFATVSKIAYSWIVNNVRAVANGGAVGSVASTTVPTGLTTFNLANVAGTPSAIHLRQFRYYPSASASNAQLQTLTT